VKNANRFTKTHGLVTVIMIGAASLSCHMDNMSWHMCESAREYSFNWPGNIDIDHYEPRVCPFEIDDNPYETIGSSGWVVQNGTTVWSNSLMEMIRPDNELASDPQTVAFAIFFDGSFRASHSVEYVPGRGPGSRCYDYAFYQLKNPNPNYRTDEPWGRVEITYSYGTQSFPNCSQGGGGESRAPIADLIARGGP